MINSVKVEMNQWLGTGAKCTNARGGSSKNVTCSFAV